MVSAQVRLALQAMRYYRLWIYASNLVLMAGVVIFASVAAALLADPRRQLLPAADVSPRQPSVLYAYAALVLQGAVLPVVGCVGALRLSEKLLNSYWMLLLVLLAGDLLVGVVWVFRFQRLVTDLVPELRHRLSVDYGPGADDEFTAAWDLLQTSARCCGVESPADFNNSHWMSRMGGEPHPSTSAASALTGELRRSSGHASGAPHHSTAASHSQRTARPSLVTAHPSLWDQRARLPVPRSCCTSASLTGVELRYAGFVSMANDVPPGRKEVYGTGKHRQQLRDYNERLHAQLMREQYQLQQQLAANGNLTIGRPVLLGVGTRHQRRATTSDPVKVRSKEQTHHHNASLGATTRRQHKQAPFDAATSTRAPGECEPVWPHGDVHEAGCGEFVLSWLHRTGDTLFVLGYCVLAFVKLCFLAILRYELREMVLKIKILQSEQALAAAAGTVGGCSGGAGGGGGGGGGNGLPFTHVEMSGIRAVMARSGQHPTPPAVVATDVSATESGDAGPSAPASPGATTPHSPLMPNGEVPCGFGNHGGLQLPFQHRSSFSEFSASPFVQHAAKKADSPPDTPVHRAHHNDPGADSDSGSHCPLLPSSSHSTGQPQRRTIKDWESSEMAPQPQPSQPASGWVQPLQQVFQQHQRSQLLHENGWPGRSNGNNNEYHELREIKQTQI